MRYLRLIAKIFLKAIIKTSKRDKSASFIVALAALPGLRAINRTIQAIQLVNKK